MSHSDDEYCDLETLEALLETEENYATESPTPFSHTHKDYSQEMEEFLKAVSDESDDEATYCQKADNGNGDNSKGTKTCDGGTTLKEKSGVGDGRQNDVPKKNGHMDNIIPSSNIQLSRSSDVSMKNVGTEDRSGDKQEGGDSQDSTTLKLQKELLLMQKKMEEMQKLLLEQQNSCERDKSKGGSSASAKKNNSLESSNVKKLPTNKFHLIADDDENPFVVKNEDKKDTKRDGTSCVKSKKGCGIVKSENKNVSSKELFGDSDSDWDELDGEKMSSLSEEGKKIKRLLKAGQRERLAHTSNFVSGDKTASQSWTKQAVDKVQKAEVLESGKAQQKNDRFSLKCKSSSSDQSKPQKDNTAQSEKIVMEDFSKIRIFNPLVSSAVMKKRMDGRKLINISKIHLKVNTSDLQGDWVTIGVVVGKTNARSSNSGKPYSIWKLNDLKDLDNSVSFFLFGEVYKNHWKLDVGCVVGLLNPTLMEPMEKGKSEPAITIKNPNQLMVLGQSKDLSWCLARTKKGNRCSHFVNKNQGDFCSYHVQAEYKKMSAKRLELQGSITGVKPKSFEQKIFSKNCTYMYGGQAFVPNVNATKTKNSVTISKLQKNMNSPHRINTLSIQNVKLSKGGQVGGKERITEEKDQMFMDMLSVPSPGAMNLVAHMKNNSSESSSFKKASSKTSKAKEIQSISANDLLREHKEMMKHKQTEKRKASDLLLAASEKSQKKLPTCDPLKEVPVLGKGLSSDQAISLSISPPNQKSTSMADRSKLKAIAILQNKGGISREDPNAVKKPMDSKDLDTIQKRLKSSKDTVSASSESPRPHSTESSSTEDEPPKKKSRFLGDIDLNSSEVKAILKAKSIHKGALAEAEAEREETYFSELEKKEKMEEKLQSVTSIEINFFTCKQCQYTAQGPLDKCKTDNHTIIKTKAKKRFFACKKCKERVTTITSKFPTDPCRKCGSLCYDKTSMYKEKTGPKLESEILSLRGDEIKYLNSLQNKVYLNTVIDE